MDTSQKQDQLLKLIKEFHSACVSLNIFYSLACGTALGAVREHGFIPWDDDIDLMMRYSDYIKMQSSALDRFNFRWVSAETEKNSPVILARIYEKEVDFDKLENYPYIDIHVYVGGSCDNTHTLKAIDKSDFYAKVYWVKQRRYHNIFKRKKSFIGSFCKIPLIVISKKHCIDVFNKCINKWDYDSAEKIFPLQGYYKEKEILPKIWLEDYASVSFCDTELFIIKEYDKYLTQLYGDYMTPVRFKR